MQKANISNKSPFFEIYSQLKKEKSELINDIFLYIEIIEKHILKREFIRSTYYCRFILEATLLYYLNDLKTIKITKKLLLKSKDVFVGIEINEIITWWNKCSEIMHYQPKKSNKIYKKNDRIKIPKFQLKDLVEFVSFIYLLLSNKIKDNSKNIKFYFNKKHYYQNDSCKQKIKHELFDFIDKDCPFCKSGKFYIKEHSIKDEIWFENGLFLACNECVAMYYPNSQKNAIKFNKELSNYERKKVK